LQYLESAGFTADQLATGGYTIKTTLDPTVSAAAKAAADNAVDPNTYGVANTFAVIRPGQNSHDILAMVANRNFSTDGGNASTETNIVSNVDDEFGGGSTFKLFTTASGLELGKTGLDSTLQNPSCNTFQLPISNSHTPGYPVCNNDGSPATLPLYDALARSPNTAFVGLELDDGMSNVLDMAYRLGMRNTLMSNQSGRTPDPTESSTLYSEPQIQSYVNSPSFTLGVGPLSPLEHANVAATLASNGVWCTPNPIGSVTDRYGQPVQVNQQPCEQVISPDEASTMLNGMSHDTTGDGTAATQASIDGWTRPMSAKTGTTQNNESVGYLAVVNNYATSSLVFADGSKPAKICVGPPPALSSQRRCGDYAFGASLAAPTFFQAFEQILGNQPDQPVPGAASEFLTTQDHGPIVPFVFNMTQDQATTTLQQAGYQVSAKQFNSTATKGTVVGETPQSNQPTGTTITIYVSTGVTPPPPNAQPPASLAPGATRK
jgi:membrane peptidoglycan carboxypeptidase